MSGSALVSEWEIAKFKRILFSYYRQDFHLN